ncbi:RNA polymerase sigma factor [Actinomadura chokoriensis]|uniref:RNA polymerase sigma factor n=1 Tax=Actinomadura chokoriensis TaxID=454156 RepID=UPI003D15614C
MYATLSALPERLRSVIEPVDLDGLILAEAAAVLGTRNGTARVRLHRACKRLKAAFPPDNAVLPLALPLGPGCRPGPHRPTHSRCPSRPGADPARNAGRRRRCPPPRSPAALPLRIGRVLRSTGATNSTAGSWRCAPPGAPGPSRRRSPPVSRCVPSLRPAQNSVGRFTIWSSTNTRPWPA